MEILLFILIIVNYHLNVVYNTRGILLLILLLTRQIINLMLFNKIIFNKNRYYIKKL
jgi:hypothetical protein